MTLSSEACRPCRNQVKPIAVISGPMLLPGRWYQANRPVPEKPQPASRISATTRPRELWWSLVRTSAAEATPIAKAAIARAIRARRRLVMREVPVACRSSDQCRDRLAAQLSLGDEAPRGADGDLLAEVRPLPGRGEHDRRALAGGAQTGGDLEAVEVGKLNVEQDQVGVELADGLERRSPVLRLADHHVAVGLEHPPRAEPEARVVVDDQDGGRHAPIVLHRRGLRGTANPTPPGGKPHRQTPASPMEAGFPR